LDHRIQAVRDVVQVLIESVGVGVDLLIIIPIRMFTISRDFYSREARYLEPSRRKRATLAPE